MPPFRKYKTGNLKNTNKFSKEIFSLPMYPQLSLDKVEKVSYVLDKYA